MLFRSEDLTAELLDVRFIRVQYGKVRSVQLVYPDSAVITLTAPWLVEKLRFPLGRLVDKGLQVSQFTPAPSSDPITVAKVLVWVSFHDDICVTDQLITFYNGSPQHVSYINLHLPARNWAVRSQIGESLDHGIERNELQVFLPEDLAPNETIVLLLTLESIVTPLESHSLGEVIIMQPGGARVQVKVKDHTLITLHELYHTETGYWQLTFRTGGHH